MDMVSLTFSGSALSMSRGPQEYVELNIHGIEQVGKIFEPRHEISNNLTF